MTKYTKYKWQRKKLANDEPILAELVVFKNAKQRMLEFRYDFLGRIMRPKVFRARDGC